jgi:hypothetical protein
MADDPLGRAIPTFQPASTFTASCALQTATIMGMTYLAITTSRTPTRRCVEVRAWLQGQLIGAKSPSRQYSASRLARVRFFAERPIEIVPAGLEPLHLGGMLDRRWQVQVEPSTLLAR